MHVAVYGAGALGSVYGVRLACRTNVTVSFVVRPASVHLGTPLVIERVRRASPRRESIDDPRRVTAVPDDADLVLLAVGMEHLEGVRPVLSASDAPIVVLTPMMPEEWHAMRTHFGARVLAAFPGIAAYVREDGITRYWQPPSPTLIDEPRAGADAELVRHFGGELARAGLPTGFALGVHEMNPATTVIMIPLGMAMALAGGLEPLTRDPVLSRLATRAIQETRQLAPRLGKPMPGSTLLPTFIGPSSLRLVANLLPRISAEAAAFVDLHFGHKLLAQHRLMAKRIVALAREKGTPHEALEQIEERLGSTTA